MFICNMPSKYLAHCRILKYMTSIMRYNDYVVSNIPFTDFPLSLFKFKIAQFNSNHSAISPFLFSDSTINWMFKMFLYFFRLTFHCSWHLLRSVLKEHFVHFRIELHRLWSSKSWVIRKPTTSTAYSTLTMLEKECL